ncbi:MAG TPA: WhiB family transcriptional regulator [Nitriliruptorales bacterium]|nr:WhiB family transcriptional regulator [Nitriliruptorales bacterium]
MAQAPGGADVEWETSAACRDVDPGLFFGPNRYEPERERAHREAAAKAICATCPVITPCRNRALAEREMFGVWGGMGELERRSLLARTAGRSTRPRAG